MANLIQKFKNLFMKPDTSDEERIDRWRKEVDDADRIKDLHLKARKQDKQAKKAKKGLTIEDFEKAEQAKKKKPKRKPVTYSL